MGTSMTSACTISSARTQVAPAASTAGLIRIRYDLSRSNVLPLIGSVFSRKPITTKQDGLSAILDISKLE